MMHEDLAEIVDGLRTAGLDAEITEPDRSIAVGSRGRGDDAPTTFIVLDRDLYEEYLLSVSSESPSGDRRAATVEFQVMAERFLTKDSGGGVNRVGLISLGRNPDGSVGLLVDEAVAPDPEPPLGGDVLEWRSDPPDGDGRAETDQRARRSF